MPVEFRDAGADRMTMPAVLVKPSLPSDLVTSVEMEWLQYAGFTSERYKKDRRRCVLFAPNTPADYFVVKQLSVQRQRLARSIPEEDRPIWAGVLIDELDAHLEINPDLKQLPIERPDMLYSFVAPIIQSIIRKPTHSRFSGVHTVHLVHYRADGGSVIEIGRDNLVESELLDAATYKTLLARFVAIAEEARHTEDRQPDLARLRQLLRQAKPLVKDML